MNGINKLAGESYHILYNRVHGIRACALRLTNTYGPAMRTRDARQNVLGIWIRRLIEGAPIDVYGDGRLVRDFNYVDDAVDALLSAGASPRSDGLVFNLGGEERISLAELASLLIELNGGGESRIVPFPEDRKAIDIGDYYADCGRIRSVLGWRPTVGLAQGLARTLAYFREHGEHYWP